MNIPNARLSEEINKLNTIKANVERLMAEDERCRNDDKWLWYRYVREIQGIKLFIPFDQFEKMVTFETITRCRRKIQNTEGRYPPTKKTILIRNGKEVIFNEFSKQ